MNAKSIVLLIDAGNTRIKWAFYRAQEKVLEPTQAQVYQNPTWSLQLRQQLADRACDRIVLCSVASSEVRQQITAFAAELSIDLRVVENGFLGLGLSSTAYHDPKQLGADRCVLMIAARAIHSQGSLCVVSCGTALTVDVVDPNGRHLGGLISASPRAIRQKIVADAAGVNIDIDLIPKHDKMDSVYTQSTEQALYNGSVLSAIGLIREAYSQLQDQHPAESGHAAWHLLYSGGGMPELLPYLPEQGVYYPELIMTGLAAIADI